MAKLDEDPLKKTLLRAIIRGQSDKVVKLLTENQSKVTADESLDSADNRLLHKAARYGKANVVKALIEQCGADPNATNKFDMTPLHHAAVEGSAEVIEVLIQAGAKANLVDNSKRLPLHWTCAYGFLDASRSLVETGNSKVDLKDKDGFTPLHRCCQESPATSSPPKKTEEGQEATEAQPNVEDEKAKLRQSDLDRSEIVKLLVAKGADVNARESKGDQRPLHLAAINGYSFVCQQLVEYGAQVNATNKIGKTALIYAASEDKVDCLKVLAKAPTIDLNQIDIIHNDWNALHYAILQDNVEAVDALIKAGANAQQRDGIGRDPKVIAGDHFKQNVLDYLEKI